MAAGSVQIKEATLIKPSEPTPTNVLPLSTLDSQLFLRFTIEYLLVFNPQRGSHQNVVARVKSALAKTLVPYYPLAGRVRQQPDGPGLEVVCRAQGAVFIEAFSDHYTSNDFNQAPRHVTQWRQLLSLQVEDVLKGAPPLVLQLTWLKDGAAVLGVGINHCVCDGIGSAQFLNSLADLARSRIPTATQLKPKPIWDRHLLDPIKPPRPYSPSHHPEFIRVPDVFGTFSSSFTNEKLVPTSVIFNSNFLNELKRLASLKGNTSTTSFTSFEVLSAHVWRSWARALNLPSSQIIKLLFSINIRDRVKPSLPVGYYGNAFVLGCAQTTFKDLTEMGLSYGSTLVKKAKETVNDEHVRSLVEFLSQRKASSPDSVGTLVMSQWSRLGLEKVDFGMGRAIDIGPVCCDRYCLILPSGGGRADGGFKVMVAVPANGVVGYEHLVKSPYS